MTPETLIEEDSMPKLDNNAVLLQIRDLLAETAVNQVRMLAVLEESTGIQSMAAPGENGLEVRLRKKPSAAPQIIRPV